MKVIIAGGRDYHDYDTVKRVCDHMLSRQTEVEVVGGEAPGADALGKRYAREKGYKYTPFPADWKQYGRAAGPRRNQQMAAYAQALIAFHDGRSPGTKDMIRRADAHGLLIHVHKIK